MTVIAGRTLQEWIEFARRDDCLERMVPSDLRELIGSLPLPASSGTMAVEARFFIEHGMIHDRMTGKHVTTQPDTPFCDGIEKCCELLNALAERRGPRVFPLLFDNDWLANKIKNDPDIECEAGPDLASPPTGETWRDIDSQAPGATINASQPKPRFPLTEADIPARHGECSEPRSGHDHD